VFTWNPVPLGVAVVLLHVLENVLLLQALLMPLGVAFRTLRAVIPLSVCRLVPMFLLGVSGTCGKRGRVVLPGVRTTVTLLRKALCLISVDFALSAMRMPLLPVTALFVTFEHPDL